MRITFEKIAQHLVAFAEGSEGTPSYIIAYGLSDFFAEAAKDVLAALHGEHGVALAVDRATYAVTIALRARGKLTVKEIGPLTYALESRDD